MSRDLSCPSGKPAYKTKRAAQAAHEGAVARCDRCRWWHPNVKRARRARRKA